MAHTIITICFLTIFLKNCCSQITIQNDANSNFYSVAGPSSHISFHRTLNGNVRSFLTNSVVLKQLLFFQIPQQFNRYIHNVPAQPTYYAPRPQPENYQRNHIQNLADHSVLQAQPERGNLINYSLLSPEVSSVRFSSNGLNYNF